MDTSFYHVSERTIERVAEVAASTVPGSRNIDAKLAGLAGRSLPRIEAHIDRTTGLVAIDAEIATSYPAPVAAITDAVRATIIAHIRTLTGMDVSRVNVTVANVESIDDGSRVTWDDVATTMLSSSQSPSRFLPPRSRTPLPASARNWRRSKRDRLSTTCVPSPHQLPQAYEHRSSPNRSPFLALTCPSHSSRSPQRRPCPWLCAPRRCQRCSPSPRSLSRRSGTCGRLRCRGSDRCAISP